MIKYEVNWDVHIDSNQRTINLESYLRPIKIFISIDGRDNGMDLKNAQFNSNSSTKYLLCTKTTEFLNS